MSGILTSRFTRHPQHVRQQTKAKQNVLEQEKETLPHSLYQKLFMKGDKL